jgi:hypothetical protein
MLHWLTKLIVFWVTFAIDFLNVCQKGNEIEIVLDLANDHANDVCLNVNLVKNVNDLGS